MIGLALGLLVSQHTAAEVSGGVKLLCLWPESERDQEEVPYALQGPTHHNLEPPP